MAAHNQLMENTTALGPNIEAKLEGLLDVSSINSEAFIANYEVEDLEIEQRECQLHVKARLLAGPFLQIVDA